MATFKNLGELLGKEFAVGDIAAGSTIQNIRTAEGGFRVITTDQNEFVLDPTGKQFLGTGNILGKSAADFSRSRIGTD